MESYESEIWLVQIFNKLLRSIALYSYVAKKVKLKSKCSYTR